jgi:hypothetical protein
MDIKYVVLIDLMDFQMNVIYHHEEYVEEQDYVHYHLKQYQVQLISINMLFQYHDLLKLLLEMDLFLKTKEKGNENCFFYMNIIKP